MNTPILERKEFDGKQKLYRFSNGFGASVVCHSYSFGGKSGLWEVAIVKYLGRKITDYEITYDTPITNDVLGYLTDDDVEIILDKIKLL